MAEGTQEADFENMAVYVPAGLGAVKGSGHARNTGLSNLLADWVHSCAVKALPEDCTQVDEAY